MRIKCGQMWGAPECGLISVQIVPGFCGGSLIAINNCFNALAINAAVSSESGVMQIPSPNYLVPSSFGSLELRKRNGNEFIGQHIDYENLVNVRKLALDEYNLPRVDLIKIDV